jgi:hypothetical protein
MSDQVLMPFDHGPVPRELWSDYEEGPFATCSVCGRALTGLYQIQKVSNKRETILEMACCMECGQSLVSEFSTTSMNAIREFLTAHLDMSRGLELCAICGAPYRRAETVSASAACSRDRLVLPVIRVCGTCEEAIQELLSEQTRRAHDDFLNRTFPGVPAGLDLAPTIFI